MRLLAVSLVFLVASCGDDDPSVAAEAGMDAEAPDAADATLDRAVSTSDSAPDAIVDTGQGDGSAGCLLSDDFENPATLACWTQENVDFARVEINNGRLQIRFRDGSPTQNGWFGDNVGPALTQRVSGGFLAVLEVDAHREGEPQLAPTQGFNSAGLLLRDPASTSPGGQNWVMWNTGRQGSSNCDRGETRVAVGSEGKTTVNSRSTLCLDEGSHRGRLALCRVGPSVRLLRKLEGDATWTEYHAYERPDFPQEMDLGVLANGWARPPDLHAEFESIRITAVTSLAECSAETLEASEP